MRNLEIKVRCNDRGDLLSLVSTALAMGARFDNLAHQRDTYFRTSRGRLKLRETWNLSPPNEIFDLPFQETGWENLDKDFVDASLIAYQRPNELGSRYSDFEILKFSDFSKCRSALESVLDVVTTVVKTRALYWYDNTRIHFDEVDRLGWFVELETEIAVDAVMGDAIAQHNHVIGELGLASLRSIESSYSDLLQSVGEITDV